MLNELLQAKDLYMERALAYDKLGDSDASRAWAEAANLLSKVINQIR